MEFSETVMKMLLIFSVLIATNTCFPGSPRIYNVLITSKKNLVPSQAVSVYEPVLRTTSVGVAFPTFTYISPVPQTFFPKYVQVYNDEKSLPNILPRQYDASMYVAPKVSSESEKEQKETPYQLNFKRLYQDLQQFSNNYNENSEAPETRAQPLPNRN